MVAVLLQVLPMIASFDAGPDDRTDSAAEPDWRPGADAVTVQDPGAPVVVTVELALLEPAPMTWVAGETVQMFVLSLVNVTVVADAAVATAPPASLSVAVTLVVFGVPAGNSFRPRVAVIEAGAPAAVNVTLVTQPARRAVAAESWSVPVAAAVGWVSVQLAVPFAVVFVDEPPAAPPSRLPVVPACESVMLRPLSVVTVWPFVSWTETVIVELCVEPATMLAGEAVHPSLDAAPTGIPDGTVMRQKIP